MTPSDFRPMRKLNYIIHLETSTARSLFKLKGRRSISANQQLWVTFGGDYQVTFVRTDLVPNFPEQVFNCPWNCLPEPVSWCSRKRCTTSGAPLTGYRLGAFSLRLCASFPGASRLPAPISESKTRSCKGRELQLTWAMGESERCVYLKDGRIIDSYSSIVDSWIRYKIGCRTAARTSWVLISCCSEGQTCWYHNFCRNKHDFFIACHCWYFQIYKRNPDIFRFYGNPTAYYALSLENKHEMYIKQ